MSENDGFVYVSREHLDALVRDMRENTEVLARAHACLSEVTVQAQKARQFALLVAARNREHGRWLTASLVLNVGLAVLLFWAWP